MPQIKQFIACKNAKTATVKPFCEIKNITDTTADLYFYGDIVSDWWGAWQEEDQYPDAIKNFLAEANGKDLNIYINSGGGSVFAGIAIYNMLKRYPGKKTVHVDALAGSIASVIAFADSDMPTIPSNAYLMIHKPWAVCDGNATELRKMADTLDAVESGIWAIYEEHLAEGVTIETIKELMEAETWLNGTQAAQYFHKTECFCFTQQVLQPGERIEMPMRFIVDRAMPKDVKHLTLAYTLFDITARHPPVAAIAGKAADQPSR